MPLLTEIRPHRGAGRYKPEGVNAAESVLSDKETHRLLQACKEGDGVAWNALIRRYQPVLSRYAYSLCRNHEEAEDIVSHVLVRLYENLPRYREEASFATWLCCIARNTYLDMCVRPKHHSELSLDTGPIGEQDRPDGYDVADPAPWPETICLENAAVQEFARAIHHLPTCQRRVANLYYIQDKSYQEISDEVSLPLGTVKSRLSRARLMLRERLEMSAGGYTDGRGYSTGQPGRPNRLLPGCRAPMAPASVPGRKSGLISSPTCSAR